MIIRVLRDRAKACLSLPYIRECTYRLSNTTTSSVHALQMAATVVHLSKSQAVTFYLLTKLLN